MERESILSPYLSLDTTFNAGKNTLKLETNRHSQEILPHDQRLSSVSPTGHHRQICDS